MVGYACFKGYFDRMRSFQIRKAANTWVAAFVLTCTMSACAAPPDEDACVCESAQNTCAALPADGGAQLPDYPGC